MGTAKRTYAALLRGINVGKNKRIAMAELREMLTGLGYGDVKTLLQSGNAAFTSAAKPEAIERAMRAAIASRFGFDVAVLVRTASELAKVVDANPMADVEGEGSKLHVAFLSSKPAATALRGVSSDAFAPERFVVAGREIYFYFAKGVMESQLFKVFTDKRLGVTMTSRNWNTVTKLRALTETRG